MDFELITLFPEQTAAMAAIGVTGRALSSGSHRLRCWNPRDHADGPYRRVDDRPYGGGPGMVMLAEPLARCLAAIRAARAAVGKPSLPLIHLSPQGQRLDQGRVHLLAAGNGAILLCGRYEAIDQRFLDAEVDEEISIGDFIASGGELPALLLVDAVVRLLPGTLNDPDSALAESFSDGLLDHPHYTRPESFGGVAVPPVLLSGNHAEIARWRRSEAEAATARKRPDLLAAVPDRPRRP
ncbi:MAG: tRNA (guanosine(37)-N1)-methyltransferase TrmD [Burkholderiaceae bacterium]